MISLFQNLKNRLSQALDELYEAGCMAAAVLEEGASFQLAVVASRDGHPARRRARATRIFAKPIPRHGQWAGTAGR